MPTIMPGTNIEIPLPTDPDICPGYTGFNSVALNEIYSFSRLPARRSQIARGYGKPVIQRLPNGDLLASQYKNLRHDPNPAYPDAEEEAALCRSTDGGVTWSPPRLLGIPGRATQLSTLSTGTLILGAQGLHRSTDEGNTWQALDVPWAQFERDQRPKVQRGFGETNGVLQLPDGTLLVICCSHHFPLEEVADLHAYVLRSTDDGRTWDDATFLLNTDEVELLLLPDGRILGFARLDTTYTCEVWGQQGQVAEGGDTMALMESTDAGRTWTKPKPLGLGNAQVPGFPLLLDDGRMILVHGNRQFPFGCQAIGSHDQGHTWDLQHPLMLAFASWDNYGGHPRSIVMPDSSIMTGYYARYFKQHTTTNEDLVSHCLNWNVPDHWPPVTP